MARQVIEQTAPGGIVRSEADFTRVRDAVSGVLVDQLFACVSLVARILTKSRDVERGIKSQNSLALLGPLNDIRTQLSGLLHPGFVSAAGVDRLAHFPRYLEGMLDRLKTLGSEPGKDRARMTEYERMAKAFEMRAARSPFRPMLPPRSSRCAGCSRSTASACSRSASAPRSRCRRSAS